MKKIMDTPWDTSAHVDCLVKNGINTVIRYYNFNNSTNLYQKCLQLAEAQALSAAGLQIGVVFQQAQGQPADFTESLGLAAGQRAFDLANNSIGQPCGSAIYFAVDFDATAQEIQDFIVPYFFGVRSAFAQLAAYGPNYRVGAYGSGLVCNTLRSQGLCEYRWLSMSSDFLGTEAAQANGDYELVQLAPSAKLCDLDVDYNSPNAVNDAFGSFALTEKLMPSTTSAIYTVKVQTVLNVRQGPSTDDDVIGTLNNGQQVFVIDITDDWARVTAVDEPKLVGFASASYLVLS